MSVHIFSTAEMCDEMFAVKEHKFERAHIVSHPDALGHVDQVAGKGCVNVSPAETLLRLLILHALLNFQKHRVLGSF